MRLRIVSVLAAMFALAWSVQCTQAGVVRFTGREAKKGSIAVAEKTSNAAGTATGGVEDAGKATGTALKDGAATLGKGTALAPIMAAWGTKAAASKIWKAVW